MSIFFFIQCSNNRIIFSLFICYSMFLVCHNLWFIEFISYDEFFVISSILAGRCQNGVCTCGEDPSFVPLPDNSGCVYRADTRILGDKCNYDEQCILGSSNTSLCIDFQCRCPPGSYPDGNICKYSKWSCYLILVVEDT